MKNLTVSASPHITNATNSTRRIMLDVIIALCPALIAATYFFGYHVIINAVVCIIGCMGGELLYGLIIKRKEFSLKTSSIRDLSCIVTAIILALNIPSTISVNGWGMNVVRGGVVYFSFDTILLCLIASVFAIMLVKMLFGGIGKNFANPAAMGRIFLFIAFASSFSSVAANGLGLNATTGATWLSSQRTPGKMSMLLDMFIGNTGSAAVGETSAVAILLGYIYLSIRKVIDFRFPLILIASSFVFAFVFDGLIEQGLKGGDLFFNATAHILSGGLIFGAVFMATDYSTSPNTFVGNIIYLIGIALFTVLIRVFADYPEGFSFALVVMNLVTPLLDKYIVPKPFGYVKPKKNKSKNGASIETPDQSCKEARDLIDKYKNVEEAKQ